MINDDSVRFFKDWIKDNYYSSIKYLSKIIFMIDNYLEESSSYQIIELTFERIQLTWYWIFDILICIISYPFENLQRNISWTALAGFLNKTEVDFCLIRILISIFKSSRIVRHNEKSSENYIDQINRSVFNFDDASFHIFHFEVIRFVVSFE